MDVNASDYCMNPDLVEAKITPRTKAILPVHLFGQMADMPALQAIAARHNVVLIGDAAHTTHYSIGAGTTLALEDAIALARALDEAGDVPAALSAYEAARRPVVEKLVAASRTSAAWYERFPEHMRLAPLDFAMSYITRSGRVDPERLRAMAPRFMARYEAR